MQPQLPAGQDFNCAAVQDFNCAAVQDRVQEIKFDYIWSYLSRLL